MQNKQKNEQNQNKNVDNHNFWVTLTGLLFTILISLILSGVVWFQRRHDDFAVLTTWSNIFIVPGVWNLVFGIFWLMTKYGYGNNFKFFIFTRANRKKKKYKIPVEKNLPKSPFEYAIYRKERMNNLRFGIWWTLSIATVLIIMGIIFAIV